MKINATAAYEQYRARVNGAKGTGAPAKGAGAEKAARSDTVAISGEAAARAETSRLAASLAGEVENAASAERIDELRAAVEGGTYHVSSADIADAMLNVKA